MADVFLAVAVGPIGFNKLQVIKRLRPSLMEDPEFLNMFLDEARLAARLNHPNVVQTNEVGEFNGIYHIAMEYLEGQPLNRILSQAKDTGNPNKHFFMQVLADSLLGLAQALLQ
jgi:eukaryotic-like serine/threonine-protein kinase